MAGGVVRVARQPANRAMTQQDLKFADVNVALLDQNMSMRRLIRSSLNSIGFTSILESRNAEDLTWIIKTNDLDLILLDLDTETERICDLVREVRNEALGENPFVVIIALTWHPEREVINLTLTAGTDDVVTKPVSANLLGQRVKNLVENRREFVVTESYVGPERRVRPHTRPGELPTIAVPNTLRQKATGERTSSPDYEAIQESKRVVKIHKVYRIASRITAKIQQIEERMAQTGSPDIAQHHLRELAGMVYRANAYIVRDNLDHLASIGSSMVTVMDGVLDLTAVDRRQLEVLRLHSQAIVASVQDNDGASRLVAEALEKAANSIQARPLVAGQPR